MPQTLSRLILYFYLDAPVVLNRNLDAPVVLDRRLKTSSQEGVSAGLNRCML